MLKIVSYNANGIRGRAHQLNALRERHDPDLIGVQEIKVADEAFPVKMIAELGYKAQFHGQKGHYGVAFLSKNDLTRVQKGFPTDEPDAQRRAITAEIMSDSGVGVSVFNGYFPQGESRDHPTKYPGKRRFYADLSVYLRQHFSPDQPLIVLGDMNVAPSDADIGIGADNAKRWLRGGKCSFLPEEREWLKVLTDWGLHDAFRVLHPDVDDRFSWFDYRSHGFDREPKRGLRIDLVLVTEPLRERLVAAEIDYDIRAMEKPSDHCPVCVTIDI